MKHDRPTSSILIPPRLLLAFIPIHPPEQTGLHDAHQLLQPLCQRSDVPFPIRAISSLGKIFRGQQRVRKGGVDDEIAVVGDDRTGFGAATRSDGGLGRAESFEGAQDGGSGQGDDLDGDGAPLCQEVGLEFAMI